MKSLIVAAIFSLAPFLSAYACEDIATTKEIVKYVCDYSLVSDTQCTVWTEDIRQMHHTNKIIVNSFLSWDDNLNDMKQLVAETN